MPEPQQRKSLTTTGGPGRAPNRAMLRALVFLLALTGRAAVEEVRIDVLRDPLPELGAAYIGPAEVNAKQHPRLDHVGDDSGEAAVAPRGY
jgi:hypothetical protein